MTERFRLDAVETLRAGPVRDAALGFFAAFATALNLVLAVSGLSQPEPDFEALGLRGPILTEAVQALLAEADGLVEWPE